MSLSRIKFSSYVEHVTILVVKCLLLHYCMMFSTIGLRLWLGIRLALVSGWLVVTHTYLHYFLLSLSLSHHMRHANL